MSNNGPQSWFAVSRMIFDHYLVGIHNRPYTDTEAWLWLVSRAEFEQSEVANKGNMIVLDPGQLMAAHGYLAKIWMWTEDKVRWFLKRLQTEAMITRECNKGRRTNQIQIISICNYSNYQYLNEDQHQAKQHQATHHAEHQPVHHAEHQARETVTTYKREEISVVRTEQHQATYQSEHTTQHQPLHQESNTKRHKNKDTSFEMFDMQPAAPDPMPIKQALEAYNSLASRIGLSTVRVVTKTRAVHLRARLKEQGLEGFQAMLAKVEASPFLRGENNRTWRPTLDWLLVPNNFAKCIEGVYDPRQKAITSQFDDAYYDRVRNDRLEREAMEAANATAGR